MTDKKIVEKAVLDYCNAAANLYGFIPVRKLFEIYNSQNDPLTEKELCDTLEKILTEPRNFDLFSKEELESGEPETDDTPTLEKILLAEYLYIMGDFDDYYELEEKTRGLPYHILEKDKFLKYTDELYVEKTLEFISLRAYFRSISELSREEADDFALDAAYTMRLFDNSPEMILQRMKATKTEPKNRRELERFLRLCHDMGCKLRLASLRGATTEELLN